MFKTLFAAVAMMMAVAAPSFAWTSLEDKYRECESYSSSQRAGCEIQARREQAAEQEVDRHTQERRIWGPRAVKTCRDIVPSHTGVNYYGCLQHKSH